MKKYNWIILAILLSCLELAWALDYAEEDESDETKKSWLKNPTREVSVIVTDVGYYPEKIVAFKGEKLKFYITSTHEEASCFIVDGHKIFVGARKGKITEAETVVEHSGSYKVYCPSNKFEGELLVLEKKREKPKREVASESKNKKIWLPKEH